MNERKQRLTKKKKEKKRKSAHRLTWTCSMRGCAGFVTIIISVFSQSINVLRRDCINLSLFEHKDSSAHL